MQDCVATGNELDVALSMNNRAGGCHPSAGPNASVMQLDVAGTSVELIRSGKPIRQWIERLAQPGDTLRVATFEAGAPALWWVIRLAARLDSSVQILSDRQAADWHLAERLKEELAQTFEWRLYPAISTAPTGSGGLFHPKLVLIGSHSAAIGSANLTGAAWGLTQLSSNVELSVGLTGAELQAAVSEVVDLFEEWWGAGAPIVQCTRKPWQEGDVSQSEINFVAFSERTDWGVGQVHRVALGGILGVTEQSVVLSDVLRDRYCSDPDFRPVDEAVAAANPVVFRLPAQVLTASDITGLRDQSASHFRRLCAYWLQDENRQGEIDSSPVLPLRHQASLVEFLLRPTTPRRMLIADEVGLGKTVEMGLLLQHLFDQEPHLRVLYVTPGGLVGNVANEFRRMGLPKFTVYGNWEARRTFGGDARMGKDWEPELHDRFVIASLHRLGRRQNAPDALANTVWDVLIVDECHRLRAYNEGEQMSVQEWFRLVETITQRHVSPVGRVYFLSGTPHQGNTSVFLNLAGLLQKLPRHAPMPQKRDALRGTVVYRIKEDIVDWDGNPLFPKREVREPLRAVLPLGYNDLLREIRDHFTWVLQQGASQAIGFVQSQALQYAASSPRAGFAYLFRRYLRYFGDSSRRQEELLSWAARLVPYRGTNLAPSVLLAKLQDEVRLSPDDPDVSDDGNLTDDTGPESAARVREEEERRLARLLNRYAELLDSPEASAKFEVLLELLLGSDEPFVVFAQSVDTVYEIKRILEGALVPTRILVGGQEEMRGQVIQWFNSLGPTGLRALVSSSAGGEGINLQVARRLVHFDLPWNPMVLEQRIGRVHRVGSVNTILVDTILLDGSRETEIYLALLDRLTTIVRQLGGDPVKQEERARRILSGIPLEKLRELYTSDRDDVDNAIGDAVTAGWAALHEVDAQLSEMRREWEEERGLARMTDLVRLLLDAGLIEQTDKELSWLKVEWDPEEARLQGATHHSPLYSVRDGSRSIVASNEEDALLVFDRGAAAYRGLARNRTGGINHPLIARGLHSLRAPAKTAGYEEFVVGLGTVPMDAWAEWGITDGFALLLTYLIGQLDDAREHLECRRLVYRLASPSDGLRAVGESAEDRSAIQRIFWENLTPHIPEAGRVLTVQELELLRRLEEQALAELLPQTVSDAGRPIGAVWPIAATVLFPREG
jgi:superfamily II DNA or RNA helicase